MKLNKELAEEAKKKGVCAEWYSQLLHTEDKHALIKMFLKGIDFCISEGYPSPRLFRQFDGIRQQHGIFQSEQIQAENFEYVVALGQCQGAATYTGYAVGQVFVKHNTKLSVTASGSAFVMVDVFDGAQVEVAAKGNAKICVNQYGGSVASSELDGAKVKIIRKQSKTYKNGSRQQHDFEHAL
ncbi:MAG: hypothetical protein LBJ57_02695 [Prevotellaceae bacterium]|jgi:hypothetical protein|nr:hypothetical protein [Prevotellaceae bacterium]